MGIGSNHRSLSELRRIELEGYLPVLETDLKLPKNVLWDQTYSPPT